jgi:hypothetical protein
MYCKHAMHPPSMHRILHLAEREEEIARATTHIEYYAMRPVSMQCILYLAEREEEERPRATTHIGYYTVVNHQQST